MSTNIEVFLSSLTVNHFYLTKDEHKGYYDKLTEIILEKPEDFEDVPPEELARMVESDSAWCLQIYWNTPIGFSVFYGETLQSLCGRVDKVIMEQMSKEVEGDASA